MLQKANGIRLRRVSGQTVSLPQSPGSSPDLVGFVESQFNSLYDLCKKFRIPIPVPPTSLAPVLPEKVEPPLRQRKPPLDERAKRLIALQAVDQILKENPGLHRSAAKKLYEARIEKERRQRISERSKSGWITRRGVAAIMEKIPGIEKKTALAVYEIDHPRSRISILRYDEATTPGERRWVGRVKHILEAANERGENITWEIAHQRAVNGFQHPRGHHSSAA